MTKNIESGRPMRALIRSRRSVRRFTEVPVSSRQIRSLLEAARWAPSGLNNQPWRFVTIRRGEPLQEKLASLTTDADIIRRAALLVVVLLKKDRMYSAMKDHQAAGACIQNMLLAAHASGLGAVWLGEILNREKETLRALRLKVRDYELMAVIAAGHPARIGRSSRLALEKLIISPTPPRRRAR